MRKATRISRFLSHKSRGLVADGLLGDRGGDAESVSADFCFDGHVNALVIVVSDDIAVVVFASNCVKCLFKFCQIPLDVVAVHVLARDVLAVDKLELLDILGKFPRVCID